MISKIFPVPPEVHRFKESLRRLSGDNNELPLINIENVPEVRQTFYASVFGDSSGLPPSEKDRAEELVDIDGQQFPRRVIMETLLLGIENTLRKMTRKLPVESDQQERNLARPSDEGLNPSYHLNGYSNTQGNVCLNTQGSQAVYLEPQVRPQNPRVVNADLARHPTGSLENISSFENLSLSHPEGKSLHSLSFGSEEETKMFRSRHILKPEDDVNLIRAEAKALPTAAPGITSKDHARLTFGPFQQLPPGLQQQQVLQFLPQAGSLYHQYDINGSPVTWQSPSIYPPSSVFTNFPGRQVVHPSPGLPPYGLQAFVPQQFPPNTPSILPQSPLFRDVGSTPISSAAYIGQIQEHGPPWRSVYPQPSCSPSPLWMQGLSPRNNDPSRIESPRSNEWSTRTGGKVVPAISKLPFRPGSDDMYPRPIVRGASVKFQELVREEVPTFEHFMRPDLMPFAENARNWKAVEWGVLKISNVSQAVVAEKP